MPICFRIGERFWGACKNEVGERLLSSSVALGGVRGNESHFSERSVVIL